MMIITNLETLPLKSKTAKDHIWADYIEFLCLINPDGEISKADIRTKIWNRHEAVETIDDDILVDDNSSLLPDEFDSDDSFEDFHLGELVDEYIEPSTSSEHNDKMDACIDTWFEHLKYRSRVFGNFYPFELYKGSLRCKAMYSSQPESRLYIFLLFSSCLKYLHKRKRLEFTNRFEIISMVALKSFLPRKGKVFLVGKNKLNKGKYRGKIWDKIKMLADEIGDSVSERAKELKSKHYDTGDGGLDLFGKISFGDMAQGHLILFGQCGCGKDWEFKQLEAHIINWGKFIDFTVPPNNLVFIPYCFRGADGGWFNYLDITESILVDRLRLVSLLKNKLLLLKRIHSYDDVLDEALAYKEPFH